MKFLTWDCQRSCSLSIQSWFHANWFSNLFLGIESSNGNWLYQNVVIMGLRSNQLDGRSGCKWNFFPWFDCWHLNVFYEPHFCPNRENAQVLRQLGWTCLGLQIAIKALHAVAQLLTYARVGSQITISFALHLMLERFQKEIALFSCFIYFRLMPQIVD